MKALADCKLYTFLDTAYLSERNASDVARQLCEGGSDLIQLRAKGLPIKPVREMALEILPILRRAGVGLVLNDYPELANEVGADLVHLGQQDFFHRGVMRTSQTGIKLGLSTHSPEDARRALQAGPQYIAVGPVYRTATKPDAKPVTLEYVRWAKENVGIPWFAIGGITLDNLDEVLAAGAERVAVVSAILKAKNIVGACQMFKQRLTSPPPKQTL